MIFKSMHAGKMNLNCFGYLILSEVKEFEILIFELLGELLKLSTSRKLSYYYLLYVKRGKSFCEVENKQTEL